MAAPPGPRLVGLHHVTMITADAQRTVDFQAGVLGLRLVKKTVNFDAPDAYHLYFGDEAGTPGSILTWFEFAGVRPGVAGAGMIGVIELGVATAAALDFWARRLTDRDVACDRDGDALRFRDPDGLAFALVVADADAPLRAVHPEVPAEHAIVGIVGARAYAPDPAGAAPLLTEILGFADRGDGAYRLDGERRGVDWAYDAPPAERGRPGAGTVHHIAFAARDEDHVGWQARVGATGLAVTDVRDRDYFKSIYFREPRGVLFEIATLSPGFAVDEAPDHLGERLCLPAQHEHLRAQLEQTLRPVRNPRSD